MSHDSLEYQTQIEEVYHNLDFDLEENNQFALTESNILVYPLNSNYTENSDMKVRKDTSIFKNEEIKVNSTINSTNSIDCIDLIEDNKHKINFYKFNPESNELPGTGIGVSNEMEENANGKRHDWTEKQLLNDHKEIIDDEVKRKTTNIVIICWIVIIICLINIMILDILFGINGGFKQRLHCPNT